MLRYADLHYRAGRMCEVPVSWPPPEKSRPKVAGMPRTFQEARVCVDSLGQYKLIEFFCHSGGATIRTITGDGLQCLWELGHPDIVEKVEDWARRSPVVAWLIVAVVVLGAISGIVSLVWNIRVFFHPAAEPPARAAVKAAALIWTWLHA